MLAKKILLPILLITLSPALFADTLSDDEIQKALEGITQITVMASAEPKVISEVSVKTPIQTADVEKTEVTKKKVHKKRVHKKRVHKKRIHKKRRVVKKHEDLSDLPIAKTLGVTETSAVFTGKY